MHLPEDRRGWAKLAGVLVLVVAAYLLVRELLPDIDPQQVLEDVSETLGQWTYAIVGVLAFLETGAFVGLVVPGETFVVLAGAVAGQGVTSVVLTIGIVWISAFLGDLASYMIGVKLGRGFVIEHGPKLRITRERFAQVESYFDRHGGKTILIGRFIGIVRALAPFVAGSSGMRYRDMAPYSILGTGLWATTFTLLGYFASRNIDVVLEGSERVLFGFGVLVAAIVGGIVLTRYLRVEENRRRVAAGMESRPVLRQLLAFGRVLAPPARFLRERLTPGGLGLEFTTALAALAVGSYIFVAYALITGDNPGPTPGDSASADIAWELRSSWLTSVAEVVTALGSGIVVGIVMVITAIWLALRRHWVELVVLVAGTGLISAGVDIAKQAIERPRPAGGLIDAGGFAYPSGHAANSVVYVWIALTIVYRLRTGMQRATALATAALLLAAAIGLSRVYLDVHYMSDVSGGWALGVSIFSLLAAITVTGGYLRQNGDRGA